MRLVGLLSPGLIVAFLKFADAVQETFAVQVLHGLRFPTFIHGLGETPSASFIRPEQASAEVSTILRET